MQVSNTVYDQAIVGVSSEQKSCQNSSFKAVQVFSQWNAQKLPGILQTWGVGGTHSIQEVSVEIRTHIYMQLRMITTI